MSDHTGPGGRRRRPRLPAAALGLDRRATVAGTAVAALVALATLASEWLPVLLLADGNAGLVGTLDGLAAAVVLAAVLANPAGVVYGLWNGGPVVAFALPLTPVATGALAAGHLALTVDLAMALCGAAASATVATAVTCRAGRSVDVDPGAVEVGLALSTAATVVAAVALGRVLPAVGYHAEGGVLAAVMLLAVAVGGLAVAWARALPAGTTGPAADPAVGRDPEPEPSAAGGRNPAVAPRWEPTAGRRREAGEDPPVRESTD